MLGPSLIQTFVKPLEEKGLSYLVSGSVASIIYGEPRATMDIDLAVFLSLAEMKMLPEIFPPSEFYLPPVEVIRLESLRETRGHYNVIHHESGLKADFYPSRNHHLLPWALENARKLEVDGISATISPPEYLIVWKLEFYAEGGSEKHLRDIRGVLEGLKGHLDTDLIAKTCRKLGLRKEWEMVYQEEDI